MAVPLTVQRVKQAYIPRRNKLVLDEDSAWHRFALQDAQSQRNQLIAVAFRIVCD